MNKNTSNDLKETLLTLPITLEGKVQLWLTYKGLKPVSTVAFLPTITSKEKAIFNTWTKEANLFQSVDHKSDAFIFVSKDKALSQKAADIMWSETHEALVQKSKLFGYPEETVLAYKSKNRVVVHPNNFHKYWAPYVRYIVRPEYIERDSLPARVWADVIRNEIPALALQFEEYMKNSEIRLKYAPTDAGATNTNRYLG